MIWDGLIVYFCIAFAIAGWHIGLLNSWAAPISMIAATIFTHAFYSKLGGRMVFELGIPADVAVFVCYIFLFLVLECLLNISLVLMAPWRKRKIMGKSERYAGAMIGIGKFGIAMVFAALASLFVIDTPLPRNASDFALWLDQTTEESVVIALLREAALKSSPNLIRLVVSSDKIHVPTSHEEAHPKRSETAERIQAFFQDLHELEQQASE